MLYSTENMAALQDKIKENNNRPRRKEDLKKCAVK
jgi:hypothetical protein